MCIRVALHTGEVELRDGDYFGRAVNRAARLRSLAAGGQILCSGATAELVIDTLPDDVVLADLGMRQLKNLPRPEHVFELRLENADDFRAPATEVPIERPGLPSVLAGPGPFVGRGPELERLLFAWQTTLAAGSRAVLIAGEPGVGKTRLAGEWSRQAYEQGALVLYGRCDEDLGAPYQPFAEALRSLHAAFVLSQARSADFRPDPQMERLRFRFQNPPGSNVAVVCANESIYVKLLLSTIPGVPVDHAASATLKAALHRQPEISRQRPLVPVCA